MPLKKFVIGYNSTDAPIKVNLQPSDVVDNLGRGFVTRIIVPAGECRVIPITTWCVTGRRTALREVTQEESDEIMAAIQLLKTPEAVEEQVEAEATEPEDDVEAEPEPEPAPDPIIKSRKRHRKAKK